MRYRGQNLNANDVLTRITLGLFMLILLGLGCVAIGGLLLLLYSLVWQIGIYLVQYVLPYLVAHPMVIGFIPIVLGVLALAFVTGDDILTHEERKAEQELKDRLWKMN